MSQRPDQIIAGKYRLIRRLARGGMGSVYRARHLQLETDVALKFLRGEGEVDEQSLTRFKREARAAAQLKSPHVVRILDYGVEDQETPYIAMELLEGEDLSKFLDRVGVLPFSEALEIIEEAGEGLKIAHRAGVVHRDIKPANIFLALENGRRVVKLLDFGIAKETASPSGETTTGMVFGSPAYMSPEQARGSRADVRGDIWSLGALFYRMILGDTPFSGANASDIVVKLCTEEAASASARLGREEPELDQLFSSVLAKDPKKRFASVEEFLEACRNATGLPERVSRTSITGDRESKTQGRVEETIPLSPTRQRITEEPPQESSPYPTVTTAREKAPQQFPRRLGFGLLLGMIALALIFFSFQKKPTSPSPSDRSSIQTSELRPSPVPSPRSLRTPAAPESPLSQASPAPDARGPSTGDRSENLGEAATGKTGTLNKSAKRISPVSPPSFKNPPPPETLPAPTADRPTTDPVFGLPVGSER